MSLQLYKDRVLRATAGKPECRDTSDISNNSYSNYCNSSISSSNDLRLPKPGAETLTGLGIAMHRVT